MSANEQRAVTANNEQIVRDHYAATNARDFARAMSHYADDVELVVPSDIRGGTFKGRAEAFKDLGLAR